MVTQSMDLPGQVQLGGDSPAERRFQAKLDADAKIEPRDWMPEAYRRTLLRQI